MIRVYQKSYANETKLQRPFYALPQDRALPSSSYNEQRLMRQSGGN